MIWAGEDWSVLERGAPSFPGRDVFGLVDGKVTSQVVKLLDVLKIKEVFGTSAAWRPFQGWLRSIVKVDHSEVGGVTTCVSFIMRHVRGSKIGAPAPIREEVPRDASMILSYMEEVRSYRTQPASQVLAVASLVNLGTEVSPFYCGGGLLPGTLDSSVQVLTPGLFVRKGCWGLPRLVSREVLLAKDVSEGSLEDFVAPSDSLF
jgi:hypothetical protein